MNLGFLSLPDSERQLYIEQAATRRGLSSVILEKDFWVCLLLGILFESRFAKCLVFEGGTSLSKVHGIIKRFSEDIDLSVSPDFLNLPEAREQGVAKPINGWPGLRLPAGFPSKPGSCLISNP